MKELFHDLRAYGEIIADKEHTTNDGHFIRFTTYRLDEEEYTVTMYDGDAIVIGKRVHE